MLFLHQDNLFAAKGDAILQDFLNASCLLDGDIVLIQQEDHGLMMVALHHVHEAAQGLLHIRDIPDKRKACSTRAGLSFVCQYGSYSNSIVAGGLPVQS